MPANHIQNGDETHRRQLIQILQAAYSGELAAGFAYRGHWKSVTDPVQRAGIQNIEAEEWTHRKRVGEMLQGVGARPVWWREARMGVTGRVIGAACHLIGWFLPMYFAGRLESRNWKEYETAAFHANALGLIQFEGALLVMSAVEYQHEVFFGEMVAGHRLLPVVQRFFGWELPADRDPRAQPAVNLDQAPKLEAAD